jgi:putative hydrolase of the HAD superfamily
MSIISNGFSEVQFRKLENAKLTPFFDHVVCSEMVGYTKPDKRVFDYALQLTKTKASESIMIGDDIRADVLGSEAIGMTGILFDENEKNRYAHEIHRVKDLSEIPLLITKL